MKAEKILLKLVNLILQNLEELRCVFDDYAHQFEYGEKVAYAECLEAIQAWGKTLCGKTFCLNLNFDVEKTFLI